MRRSARLARLSALIVVAALLASAGIACSTPATAVIVPVKQPLPDQESLQYRLLDDNGHQIATTVIAIDRQGDGLILQQSTTTPAQETDKSIVTVDATTLRPRTARREIHKADLNAVIEITYGNGTVTTVANDGSEHRHTAKVGDSAYDDLESFFLLRTLDFTPDYTVHYGSVVTDVAKGTISRALGTARVLGKTTLKIGSTQYTAWQVQLTGAGATNTAWFEDGPARRLVRYHTSNQTVLELTGP